MKKKIKKILLLATATCLLMNSLLVTAASSVDTTSEIQYEAIEITNPDALIALASQGVDEFAEETGLDFNLDGEMLAVNNSISPFSRNSLESVHSGNIEVYKTSQYLGTVVGSEGEEDKVYALNGIILYSDPSRSDSKTNGGCTIVTTLHCAWNSNLMKLKLIDSQAYITGTLRPSSLLMENNAYEGWITNKQHYNSRQVLLPSNGYYTLSSTYQGYISDYGSYLIAEDTLSFGSGGTLKTHVYISPEGY